MKLANKYTCTGCMACVDTCAKGAISCTIGNDGHYYPSLDSKTCVQCGLCQKVCPVLSKFDYRGSGKTISFAAWNTDDEQIMKSASGGIFSALATAVINNGGYVVGVAMEESQAFHKIISRTDEIVQLQGSKYQQSLTSGIYTHTVRLLKEGKLVLFQGTGCQVAGLYGYLRGKTYENLITVDLICGGVPSRLLIDKFKELTPGAEIISYRDKQQGWCDSYHLTIEQNGEKKRDSQHSQIIKDGYACKHALRYSCYNCPFVGVDRKADFTIADFWGDKEHLDKKHTGVSYVAVHTEKGMNLMQQCNIEYHRTDVEKVIVKNPRLICGKTPLYSYGFGRRFIGWNFIHLSYSSLLSVYAGKYRGVKYLIIKIYNYLLWRASKHIQRKKINKLVRIYNESIH